MGVSSGVQGSTSITFTHRIVIHELKAALGLDVEHLQPLVGEKVGEDEIARRGRLVLQLLLLADPLFGLAHGRARDFDANRVVSVLRKQPGVVAAATAGNERAPRLVRLEDGQLGRRGHQVLERGRRAELVPREEVAVVPERGPLAAVVFNGPVEVSVLVRVWSGWYGSLHGEEVLAETLAGLGGLQDLICGDKEAGLVVNQGSGRGSRHFWMENSG